MELVETLRPWGEWVSDELSPICLGEKESVIGISSSWWVESCRAVGKEIEERDLSDNTGLKRLSLEADGLVAIRWGPVGESWVPEIPTLRNFMENFVFWEVFAMDGMVWLRLTPTEFSFCAGSEMHPHESRLKSAHRAFFMANRNSFKWYA